MSFRRILFTSVHALFLFASVQALFAQPRDIRIVAPYAGWVNNVYVQASPGGDISLDDTDLMLGLYAQWIRPGSFQANLFAYHAPEVNYSVLSGLHGSLDFYFDLGPVQDLVLGGGAELVSIDMDAGANIAGLDLFGMQNLVTAPFLRVGKQFTFKTGNAELVALPWAGAELDFARGDIAMDPVGFAPLVEMDIDETELYALSGLNLRLVLMRFVQLEAKYSAAFDDQTLLSRASVMANVFVTRTLGLSYRFSYMETSSGSTMYNILGAAVMF
jgi:hypothetical protein